MTQLKDRLKDARARFDRSIAAANETFSSDHPFRDFVRLEGKGLFDESLHSIFEASYAPIVSSSGSLSERLSRCAELFAMHKTAYEEVFADSANREVCVAASVKSLKKAFKGILGT